MTLRVPYYMKIFFLLPQYIYNRAFHDLLYPKVKAPILRRHEFKTFIKQQTTENHITF